MRSGLFCRNQLTAFSKAFLWISFLVDPRGKGTPARSVNFSKASSSRRATSGLLLRSHSRALSMNFFLFTGVLDEGKGTPVSVARDSRVGSSKSPGCGELFLNQLMALSMAFCFASSGDVAAGRGTPASLARESTVGASKFPSRLGSLFRSQSNALSTKLSLFLDVLDLGIGRPVRVDKASKVGSSKSSGLGSLLRSQLRESSKAFFFESFGTMPGGREWPARFVTASTVGSSRCLSRLGLFWRIQFKDSSMNFFLFLSVIFLGNGRVVSLEKASTVGSSRPSRTGSLLRNQLMASSIAFFFGAVGMTPCGSAFPARFVIASTVGSSRLLSKSGSFLRIQSRESSTNLLSLALVGVGIGMLVSFERAAIVGSSRPSRTGSLLRSQLIALSMAFFFDAFGTMPGGRS